MLDRQWPDGLMQSEHVRTLKIGVGLFYDATPVLFFMRENSRNSEQWKNMKNWIWPIAFFEIPKIETFWKKTTVDATTIRSGSERLSPEPFTWKHVSFSGNHVSFRWKHVSFSRYHVSFRWKQVSFSGNHVSFRWPLVTWRVDAIRARQQAKNRGGTLLRCDPKNTYQKCAMGQMKNHSFCIRKKRLRVKFWKPVPGSHDKESHQNPRPPIKF